VQKNFKLTIEYDGTEFHGWQRQKNARTIQGDVEAALATILKDRIVVTGAGRTDAGVHALGQVANFHCHTRIPPSAMCKALNSVLAEDIVIKNCELVEETFHARYDARSKTYRYTLLNRPLPMAIGRQYAWHLYKKLDFAAMQNVLPHICGFHDFRAFEGAGSPRSHTTRNILNATLVETQRDLWVLSLEADGFLRYMVRNLVGSLVAVGHGKLTVAAFKALLASKDRSKAPPTAPARGLCLVEVKY
jgi:tRNA pseudouridine38-40 synthase